MLAAREYRHRGGPTSCKKLATPPRSLRPSGQGLFAMFVVPDEMTAWASSRKSAMNDYSQPDRF